MLAGIGDVGHRGALHVAFPAQVIEFGSAMHGAAIVPDHQVVDTPAMRVDELPLGRVRYESIDRARPSGSGMPKMRPAWEAR